MCLIITVPAPGLLGDVLSNPPQRVETVISTYVLQTLGMTPSVTCYGIVVFLRKTS